MSRAAGGPSVAIEVPADLGRLAEVGAFVRERCRDHPRLDLIELAVHELLVNAVRHGRAERCRIEIRRRGGTLEIGVVDDGIPFDPTAAPILPAGELRDHGYGLTIVRAVAAEIAYARLEDRNRLTLTVAG